MLPNAQAGINTAIEIVPAAFRRVFVFSAIITHCSPKPSSDRPAFAFRKAILLQIHNFLQFNSESTTLHNSSDISRRNPWQYGSLLSPPPVLLKLQKKNALSNKKTCTGIFFCKHLYTRVLICRHGCSMIIASCCQKLLLTVVVLLLSCLSTKVF